MEFNPNPEATENWQAAQAIRQTLEMCQLCSSIRLCVNFQLLCFSVFQGKKKKIGEKIIPELPWRGCHKEFIQGSCFRALPKTSLVFAFHQTLFFSFHRKRESVARVHTCTVSALTNFILSLFSVSPHLFCFKSEKAAFCGFCHSTAFCR